MAVTNKKFVVLVTPDDNPNVVSPVLLYGAYGSQSAAEEAAAEADNGAHDDVFILEVIEHRV